ncbi:MAG TPA: hypothetical protein VK731_02800 [Candidatus Cybelea sp.]|jgi:hypothetical protein|nr:hypothetical protein [Candidatus Cybelea sp.]
MNPIKIFGSTLAAVFLLAACLLARAADTNFSLPPETAQLKPGPGVDLASANCSLCHSADYISTQPRLTRTAWKAEVTKMQQKYGAPLLANNIEALTDYLTKSYGKDDPQPKPEKK